MSERNSPYAIINSNSSLTLMVNLSQTYINSTSTEIKVEDCNVRMSMKNITVNCKDCSAAERSTIDSSLLKAIHNSNEIGCS